MPGIEKLDEEPFSFAKNTWVCRSSNKWLWSGIPSFSGSLIASEKWAKKETHSYWQWCSQLNSNASYLSHFVLWQQKKAVWSISRYVHHAAHAIHCGSFVQKNSNYYDQEGSQNGGSKVIMSEIDCVTVQLAGSTTVNTSELLFWLIIAIQSSCQKMNCNAWSQSLVWWSTNPSFFFKRKFQVPVQYNESAKKSCYLKFTLMGV